MSYLRAVGSKALFLILGLFGLEQVSTLAASFWLTKWTADSELHNLTKLPADSDERYQSNVYYLSIYGSLGFVQGKKAYEPRQAKSYLRIFSKCADSDHPAHAQSIIWTYALHSVVSNDSVSGKRRPRSGPSLSAYAQRHVFAWRGQ